MFKQSISICGLGLVTPLEAAGRSTWQAIAAGERVVNRGVVSIDLDGPEQWDRAARLAYTAGRRAVGEASWGDGNFQLFVGTSKGPSGTVLQALDALRRLDHPEQLDPHMATQVALGPAALGALVAEGLGANGSVHTSVAACASGIHALHRAAEALHRGECERALVVAGDASVHDLFESGFARLGVLAKADDHGDRRCRPFDPRGEGFILTEGAAAVALEIAKPGQAGVRLEASTLAADGMDLLAVDAGGRALRAALRACQTDPSQLAFVHAHATGTAHDAYELAAIRSTCGQTVPVFSHKGWLGHSLGAAGLMAVVLSAMCHRHGATLAGRPISRNKQSLTAAQGFGGHIGVVRLSDHGH